MIACSGFPAAAVHGPSFAAVANKYQGCGISPPTSQLYRHSFHPALWRASFIFTLALSFSFLDSFWPAWSRVARRNCRAVLRFGIKFPKADITVTKAV